MIHRFITGALSAFRLGDAPIKRAKQVDIKNYFEYISGDIDNAYKKLKKTHEGN